jgi:hypothetical protein
MNTKMNTLNLNCKSKTKGENTLIRNCGRDEMSEGKREREQKK